MKARFRTARDLAGILFAFCLGLPAGVSAQAPTSESPDPACVSRADCRFVGATPIRTDQGVKTPALNRNMPFIRTHDGQQRLWLVLGERIHLRLGAPGEAPMVILGHGRASDPEESGAALKDTIEIDFKQMGNSTDTFLIVRNGYDRQLQYKAYRLTSGGVAKPTSVCGVPPHIFSMENWPQPIIELELSDFQLADGDTTMVTCK